MNPSPQLAQTKWKEGLCPIFNGVLLRSGTLFHVAEDLKLGAPTALGEEDLSRYVERVGNSFSALSETGVLSVPQGQVVYGEGSYGGDGFVALLNEDRTELVWIFFHQHINPIRTVEFFVDALYASSTNGHTILLPLEKPTQLSVQTVP